MIIDDNENVLNQFFSSTKTFDSCYPSDMGALWKLTKKVEDQRTKEYFFIVTTHVLKICAGQMTSCVMVAQS